MVIIACNTNSQELQSYSCLAALGLVENNAPNVVAAMLVSPLMVKFFNLNTTLLIISFHISLTVSSR